jgi:hypothetical protein
VVEVRRRRGIPFAPRPLANTQRTRLLIFFCIADQVFRQFGTLYALVPSLPASDSAAQLGSQTPARCRQSATQGRLFVAEAAAVYKKPGPAGISPVEAALAARPAPAVTCAERDLDALLNSVAVPEAHGKKVRTSNVIERTLRRCGDEPGPGPAFPIRKPRPLRLRRRQPYESFPEKKFPLGILHNILTVSGPK